jgi:hypothetical protein
MNDGLVSPELNTPGRPSRIDFFVDSSRIQVGPADYWAGQRMTGGPVGAARPSTRFPTGSSVTWS